MDDWADDIGDLYILEEPVPSPLTRSARIATCQCDMIPVRPCPAPITQEDLLCDTCRAAREPGTAHGSTTLTGKTVVRTSHFTIPAGALDRTFAPEGS